jgi:CheY-like chemotaxis protein
VSPGVAHACVVEHCREKITPENSLVVNVLPGLLWTARPDGHADFLTNASANTPDVALSKPAALTRDDKSTTVTRSLVSVVDDDESVRESLPDLLKEFGFAARAFSSPEDFLASDCVRQTKCLLLDIAMPGMSGPDLQRELKIRGHGIPIVFITASTDKTVRPRLLELGAVECLFKPFSDTALLEALNLALHPK